MAVTRGASGDSTNVPRCLLTLNDGRAAPALRWRPGKSAHGDGPLEAPPRATAGRLRSPKSWAWHGSCASARLPLEVFHRIRDVGPAAIDAGAFQRFGQDRPAGPTNGRPARSSSFPGCSPTNITSAREGPSPNTVCVALFQRWHARQPSAAARSAGIDRRAGTGAFDTPTTRLRRSRHEQRHHQHDEEDKQEDPRQNLRNGERRPGNGRKPSTAAIRPITRNMSAPLSMMSSDPAGACSKKPTPRKTSYRGSRTLFRRRRSCVPGAGGIRMPQKPTEWDPNPKAASPVARSATTKSRKWLTTKRISTKTMIRRLGFG